MRWCAKTLAMAWLGVLALSPGLVRADDPKIAEAELGMLPEWCRWQNGVTYQRPQGTPPVAIEAQLAKYKRSGCGGHHHFCWALVWLNRAYIGDAPEDVKRHVQSVAIGDFDYVFAHSQPSCVLGPEMHVKSGDALVGLGDAKKAEERYREALASKPDYAPAFIGLSDIYEQQGKPEKAMEILKAGLKGNPGSSALKKKLARVESRHAPSDAPK